MADPRLLLEYLFSFRGDVKLSRIEPRRWQFFERSGTLYDRDGEVAGKVGIGNGDTVCVSLTGQGCKWVRNWHKARTYLDLLQGRITRVDVAHDDYDGERLSVHGMLERARAGEFQDGPIAPKWKFLDDGGNGTGCTLYVGQKGHKQLCVYEKGKQLGMEMSKWVRLELRLYAKRAEIPSEVLVQPMKYLRGGYSVFSGILPGVCERLKTLKKTVEATGYAVVKWARRQVGPSLSLLHQALGHEFDEFLRTRILREGAPSRFRGIPKSERPKLLRETLDAAMSYLPVPGVPCEENSYASLHHP
ncbi:phage replication protein [Lysobacteraceae bacterium NML07-0707]|nr:phage replication protein [Xanthomonadaceae bacterium NML07-0707]